MASDQPTPIGYVHAASREPAGRRDSAPQPIAVQTAVLGDAARIAAVMSEAFMRDPTWSWAFPDPGARLRYWEVCSVEALRYPWVLRTKDYEAAAIWIPPGGSEFSAETEKRLPELLQDLVGCRAAEVGELIRRFGEAHPRHEPHYYLSLLGTADAHRGRGLGMALLRENLARIDTEGMPSYLESSNPRNNHLYESVGFAPVVSFEAPGGGPVVTGMWRSRA